jgi:hypothetical protein
MRSSLFSVAAAVGIVACGGLSIGGGLPAAEAPAKASAANPHAPSPQNHASLAAYPGAVISLKDPKTHRIFYVESDGRRLVALDDKGRVAWSVDVLAEANVKPAVGQPVIRHLRLADGWLHVTCGKHDAVKVDIQSGKTQHVGADKSGAAGGPPAPQPAGSPPSAISLKDSKTERTFYVETNGRRLAALFSDGSVAWTIDVIGAANVKPPHDPNPLIRELQFFQGGLGVRCSRGDWVKVDLKTGEATYLGRR